jgi:hypothetical protein
MSTDSFHLLFSGANRPTVIKPDHMQSAAESIRDEAHERGHSGMSFTNLSYMEDTMVRIYEHQSAHVSHETVIVDVTNLPQRHLLRLLFLAVVFAYRWDADCLSGLPRVVFRVRGSPCRILQFLFQLVCVKEDLTLATLHDFLQLMLTQGGPSPTNPWLPDVLL